MKAEDPKEKRDAEAAKPATANQDAAASKRREVMDVLVRVLRGRGIA